MQPSALLIIDLQKWMFRYPYRNAQIPKIVSGVSAAVKYFQGINSPIFDIRTVLEADKSNWSRSMLEEDAAVMITGTADVEYIDGYFPPPGAHFVEKTRNSGFLGTDLHERLSSLAIDRVVLCGVFIDGCVGLTAADAAQRNYDVTFLTDCIGDTDETLREPLFRWLIDDYYLSMTTSAQL